MKNLFIGNLSFQTQDTDLRTLFETYGQVSRVHIGTDRETGRSRGFAFIEMPDDAAAGKAIAELNGKEFGGRAIKVSEAAPKTERRPPSGGGPGPRGGRGGGGGRERFSTEDYRESARQPREPRW